MGQSEGGGGRLPATVLWWTQAWVPGVCWEAAVLGASNRGTKCGARCSASSGHKSNVFRAVALGLNYFEDRFEHLLKSTVVPFRKKKSNRVIGVMDPLTSSHGPDVRVPVLGGMGPAASRRAACLLLKPENRCAGHTQGSSTLRYRFE